MQVCTYIYAMVCQLQNTSHAEDMLENLLFIFQDCIHHAHFLILGCNFYGPTFFQHKQEMIKWNKLLWPQITSKSSFLPPLPNAEDDLTVAILNQLKFNLKICHSVELKISSERPWSSKRIKEDQRHLQFTVKSIIRPLIRKIIFRFWIIWTPLVLCKAEILHNFLQIMKIMLEPWKKKTNSTASILLHAIEHISSAK